MEPGAGQRYAGMGAGRMRSGGGAILFRVRSSPMYVRGARR